MMCDSRSSVMQPSPEDQSDNEPTQKTQPKKGQPIDIPVLEREEIERLLSKAEKLAEAIHEVGPLAYFVCRGFGVRFFSV